MKDNLTPAEEVKQHIDTAVETKGAEVAKNAADALEAKAGEISANVDSKLEKMAEEAKADREVMQKSIDEIAAQRKSFFGIGGEKLNEKQEQLKDIMSEFKSKGTVKTELSQKTFVAGTSTNTIVPSMYDQAGQIYHDPNFKVQLRDVINTRTSNGGSILWNRETAETDAAAPKPFGTAQPQTSKTLTRQESTFRTLTNFYTMPEEYMDDITAFESYISNRLMMDLLDLESRQILTGNNSGNNYNGINTFATALTDDTGYGDWANSVGSSTSSANRYDVLVAVGSILEQADFTPGCIILNPFDYNQIAITKSNDGDYAFRYQKDPGTGKVATYLNTGVQVVKSNAQAANTWTVFDKMSLEYVMREGVAVEFDRNANDFAANNISIRAQLRGNIADWLPSGALTGTFTGATGGITLIQGA